ncbi:MAG TPA: hypothetical protein VKR99_06375 [Candidatus Eremiobacteraceae bacterium]|nr:hypothetical protein [Candidatus Eremiobacteraceae bacterium]
MTLSFSRRERAAFGLALVLTSIVFAGRVPQAARTAQLALPRAAAPPNPTVVAGLPQHAFMHFLLMPLGGLDGALVGRAACEPHGPRAAFVAAFPGATIQGDWRSLNPSRAFLFDPGARLLTALPSTGDARRVSWTAAGTLRLLDAAGDRILHLAAATRYQLPALRMASPDTVTMTDVVAQAGDGRLLLARNSAGRFAALQVGARTFRFEGVCAAGAYAFIGGYVVWVDHSKSTAASLSRSGPDAFAAPSFAGSAYGDAITPLLPLGHAVYQGNYRSGRMYLAFTYGMQRIVAETGDLLSFSFPRLPAEPIYTVGDGLGADDNGDLYFARPEDGQVLYWRSGRYVREPLQFPAGNGNEAQLFAAMQIVAAQDPLWPPLRPDEDALDAALLNWRIYPIGDSLGERWIASYLGRLMRSDAAGHFTYLEPPRFPFALLGRSDDGRLWGAAPLARTFSDGAFSAATSALFWSRDGKRWSDAGQLPGDAGAVGLNHHTAWVALTQPWLGRPAIALLRLGDANASLTAGTYAGEQLFFAALPSGFYLVWGATPGRRLDAQQGPLSAYKVDAALLAADAGSGANPFTTQLLQPARDPSLPPAQFMIADGDAILQPTLHWLQSVSAGRHATLVTNVGGSAADPARISVLSPEQERAYAIKYAGRCYPFASVLVTLDQQGALVRRVLMRGPLSLDESVERWTKNDAGEWTLAGSQR